MDKHTILFLAANPIDTDRLALDREARAIQVELERSGHRDRFELVTRWAVEPLDLLRELRKLKPTVVHFSGHGGRRVSDGQPSDQTTRRDVVLPASSEEPRDGLFFQGADGRAQFVSAKALQEALGAAGASVELIVLSACYTDVQSQALLAHVNCVVGMRSSIRDDAARTFAIGFYGALGDGISLAEAFAHGRAAISLEGLADADRPRLAVRDGIDPKQLVLAAAAASPEVHVTDTDTATKRQASSNASTVAASSGRPHVDIGILTIREDEFRAVLEAFPARLGIFKGAHREYTLCRADTSNGQHYTVAVLRQIEQGNGEAQNAARDVLLDLSPTLILVVGIAGGLPSDDVRLGDVVISTRIHDFTVGAKKYGEPATYSVTGGPIDKALAAALANLPGKEYQLGNWTADLPSAPPVNWTKKGQLYGPKDWQKQLREKLKHHYGQSARPRPPVYKDGAIASSDRLIKDPEELFPWISTARHLLAVEMESGGVFRAVQGSCPMLAIRGISDIVGLRRADSWTKYACSSAAAFTRAFLRTQPIPVAASPVAGDPS